MIFRISHKLNAKIKAGPLPAVPQDENPHADWSAHLFVANRTQYILLTNTKSLYSTVMYGKGITNSSQFIMLALDSIREFMEDDDQAFAYHKFIAPATRKVHFAKALNRSVTGSINELIQFATACLVEDDLSLHEVGFKLNDVLLSAIAPSRSETYGRPREAFMNLAKEPSDEPKLISIDSKRPLPRTSAQWAKEIKLAIADACEAIPFGEAIGEPITAANLFHLAPHVCLKFRGRKSTGKEAERVIKTALANYVANSKPNGIDHGLKQRPLMAFVLCYIAAHFALDLLNVTKAEAILNYCEEHLEK